MKDILLDGLSRDEWLAIRRKGLGGSDIAAIMKQSPWTTPLDVYYDKLGLSEPVEDNPRMRAGRFLESAVADMFADEHQDIVVRKDTKMRVHPRYPFMFANTDRLLKDSEGRMGVLEIKTTSSFYSKTWKDTIPFQYYVQLQHYLNVMSYEFGYVAILVDGWDYHSYYFERDQALIDDIEGEAINFWKNNVLANVEPEPMSEEDLNKLFPKEEPGLEVEADVLDIVNIEAYNEAQKDESDAKARKDNAKFAIKKSMGKAEVLVDNGFVLATLKANAKGSRILRVTKEIK